MFCRPVEHDGVRGLVVLITDADDELEVGRVAFVRERSANPDVSFEDQVGVVMGRANAAAEVANELSEEMQRLQEESDRDREELARRVFEETRQKMRQAIGSTPRQKAML